jgi:putative DNA primase/helicase
MGSREVVAELIETSELEAVEPVVISPPLMVLQPMDQVREWLEEDNPADIKLLVPVLQKLDLLDYDKVRGEVADRAGVRKSSLDETVKGKEENDREQKNQITLRDPKPWPSSVDGDELLTDLTSALNRYLFLPDQADVTIGLWVLFTHAHGAFFCSPLLAVLSPEMRCGKSTLLSVLKCLVPRPVAAANVSPAALFRVGEYRPTMLIDEGDSFMRERPELQNIVNSGHTRGTGVLRVEGDNHSVVEFDTFFPKCLAAIGSLASTIEDRSIVVRMRRKKPDEKVERLRLDRLKGLDELCSKAAKWAEDHLDKLRKADPSMPEGLSDRSEDNWRALLSIADLVGGSWPGRARQAAVISNAKTDEDSTRTQLLADVRRIFIADARDRMHSQRICDALAKMEGQPWPEWRHGKPMTPTALARQLKPFGVRPKQIMLDGTNKSGWERKDFEDAWNRYLGVESPRTTRTPASVELQGISEPLESDASSTLKNDGKPHPQRVLGPLEDEWPGSGRGEG